MKKETVYSFFSSEKKKIEDSFSLKELRTFTLFLFVSFVLWFILASRKTYVKNVCMPISYINMPNDCVFAEGVPSEVYVSIEDRGTSLLSYMMNKRKTPIEIDLTSSRDNKLITSGTLKSLIQKNLSSSTRVNSIRPDLIEVSFLRLEKKDVPVVFEGRYTPDRQYYIFDSMQVFPQNVSIYAPRKVLDSIDVALLEPVEIKGVRDTYRCAVPFVKIPNVKFSQPSADVIVVAQKFTEKTVEVPINVRNRADGMSLRLFPSSVKIEALVGVDFYEKIDASSFNVEVDCNDIVNDNKMLGLKVDSLPNGVFHVKLSDESVEYLIEQE